MVRRVRAVIGSSHPGPTVAVTVITVLLAVANGLEPWRVVLLGCAMLADQLSVGLSNDAIDAERDRASGRTDKPVARGDVTPRTVRALALMSLSLALVLTAPLGWPALGLHALLLAAAWTYNLGLKSTVLSALPYLVFFGLLPALVTVSARMPSWPPLPLLAAAALLGFAAHLANVLPDLEADRATGVRGLGHRIGATATAVTACLALGTAGVPLAIVLGGGALAWVGATAGA
ncbi:1,4-dihydroxy-2-naphthoate prenyltransferase, partial [Schumannella luteola]